MAKLSVPRTGRSPPRVRLAELLDQGLDKKLVWICAPAGFGKTTAVADWLRARSIATVWYRCDEDDGDTAAFFSFMQLALGGVVDAPTLSAPAADGLSMHAVRSYFRSLYACLPVPAVLVFEDWHELPTGAAVCQWLPTMVKELPAGLCIVIIGRSLPSGPLDRLVNGADAVQIEADTLRLTIEESAAVVQQARVDGAAVVATPDELHHVTQGWAAGLKILLRQELPLDLRRPDWRQRGMQALLAYFDEEVFQRLSADIQEFALKTCCLARVPAAAAKKLFGTSAAIGILDALVRENSFVSREAGSDVYRYHPLFRLYLLNRAARRFNVIEQQQIWADAARAVSSHDPEAAIALLLQSGDWSEAARRILNIAPLLFQQGRCSTLAEWIAALPEPLRGTQAWLLYWQGVQPMPVAPRNARNMLEQAHRLFAAGGDDMGQMLAVAAILQLQRDESADFGRLQPWIQRLDDLLNAEPRFSSPSVELALQSAFLSAASLAAPGHPRLRVRSERIASLMSTEVGAAAKAAALAALLQHFALSGRMLPWRTLRPQLQFADDSPQTAADRVRILTMAALHAHYAAETTGCRALLAQACDVALRHGQASALRLIRILQTRLAEGALHVEGTAPDCAALDLELSAAAPLLAAQYHYAHAVVHLARGAHGRAMAYIRSAIALAQAHGDLLSAGMMLIGAAEICCESGRGADAREHLQHAEHALRGLDLPMHAFAAATVRAELARRDARSGEFAQAVRDAFAIGHRHGFAATFHGHTAMLQRLVPAALQFGIELEYCAWLIKKLRLTPPAQNAVHWPWLIRIHTLGQFSVVVNGAALEFTGRTQQKPMDLLKSLLADSSGAESGQLMQRLWPDMDGDAARNSFDLALHRLRKLLQHKDCVVLSNGRVRLNSNLVWVDAHAFDSLRDAELGTRHEARRGGELLQLYQGPFLADAEPHWIAVARERLRSKFVRRVITFAAALREQGLLESAADLLRRALEIEPACAASLTGAQPSHALRHVSAAARAAVHGDAPQLPITSMLAKSSMNGRSGDVP